MTQNTLARFLREFGIRSRDIRIDDQVNKGFHAEWFDDIFSRYLVSEDPKPQQAQQPNKNNDLPPLLETQQGDDVALSKSDVSAGNHLNVADVALQDPKTEGWEEI